MYNIVIKVFGRQTQSGADAIANKLTLLIIKNRNILMRMSFHTVSSVFLHLIKYSYSRRCRTLLNIGIIKLIIPNCKKYPSRWYWQLNSQHKHRLRSVVTIVTKVQ